MVAANPEGGIGSWQESDVDVARIEAALARLWKEAGPASAAEGAAADGRHLPARSRVMNLVVYVPREDDAALAAEAIAALSDRHPSRTICVVADPDAPTSSLDASIAGQCSGMATASGQLCWENITIKAHGATAAHAPGVVIPLLLPDLPTYLWWMGDVPFDTPLFKGMVDLCDRLIVDSGLFARPLAGLVDLATFHQDALGDRGIGDFHWMRLTPWCNLAAQFFDGAEPRPYVHHLDRVRLGYARDAGRPGNVAQAALLAGWLASRLEWSPRAEAARWHGDVLHLEARRAGATVAIDVEPQEPAGADVGDVVALTLAGTLRDVRGDFRIERRAADEQASTTMTIGDAAALTRTVRMTTRAPRDLLCEELEVFRHDRVYEAALRTAAALCGRVVTEVGQR